MILCLMSIKVCLYFKSMHFNIKPVNSIYLNDVMIKIDSHCKYLGHIVSDDHCILGLTCYCSHLVHAFLIKAASIHNILWWYVYNSAVV